MRTIQSVGRMSKCSSTYTSKSFLRFPKRLSHNRAFFLQFLRVLCIIFSIFKKMVGKILTWLLIYTIHIIYNEYIYYLLNTYTASLVQLAHCTLLYVRSYYESFERERESERARGEAQRKRDSLYCMLLGNFMLGKASYMTCLDLRWIYTGSKNPVEVTFSSFFCPVHWSG